MIEKFCADDFWDLNVVWNTNTPDFSSCFQDTVLTCIPCLLFSIFCAINLCLLARNIPSNPLPWTWRIILKLILCCLLFIICVSLCAMNVNKYLKGEDVPISSLAASFTRPFTYVIVMMLMLAYRIHGVTTSTTLSLFWICLTFTSLAMHRSIILNNDQAPSLDWNYLLFMVYYPLIYVELIMSFFVDVRKYGHLQNGSPLEEEAFLSGITYVWFCRTVYRGFKRLLTVKDFLPLAVKLKSSYTFEAFNKHWEFHLNTSDLQRQSLSCAIFKAFWPWLIWGFVLEILFSGFSLLPPLILGGILQFVKDDKYAWRSYFFCAATFFVAFLTKTLWNNLCMYVLCTAYQLKSALTSAVFRKNLLIASPIRKDFTSGSITNLISVDINRISQFAQYVTSLFIAPFRIIGIIIIMWQYLGPSCMAGVAVIIVLMPVTFYVSRFSERFIDRQMTVKDQRLKCMNEILQGIKILKFYAWELPFSSKISKTRKEEIKLIRLSQFCYVLISFVFSCAPIMVSIASFAAYLLVNKEHILDPTRAFVSLTLLDQLRFALLELPDGISELIQTITSMQRLKTFFTAAEIDSHIIGSEPDEGKIITFRKASLFWSKENSFTLDNIDLNVSKRDLVAVIGPVGSGKSSLLSAILGDMYKESGSIDVQGSLAYVPQEAWILNRSLKENILLEKPMDEAVYEKVLDCCCLRPDLEMLPGRDEIEIGEKGINLSGGQKQRISLARAVFQNQDIYLLDDTLSAVDAHVRKALFDDIIGRQGLLQNKTRILVTHDISVLPYVDYIIRMDEGKILERGTYTELMQSSESFLNFIKTHSGLAEKGKLESGDKDASENTDDANNKDQRADSKDMDSSKDPDKEQSEQNLIEEEKMEEGGVKRSIYLNYAKHMGWPLITFALLGYITFTAFEAGANIWVAEWTADSFQNGTQSNSRTVWRLSIYGALGAAQAVSVMFGISCMIYGSTKASELYHNQMLQSILKSPMSFFDTTPMGRIINRFSTDLDTTDIHIIYSIDNWIWCMLNAVSTFIVIGINTPMFLASVIPLVLLYYLVLKLHINTSRQIQRLQSTTRSPIYSLLLESIFGASSIKAFKVENEFIEKLEETIDNHIACCFSIAACNRWLSFFLDAIIGCSVLLIATWQAIANRHTLGASFVGLILSYALSVTSALLWLVRANAQLENQLVAVERIDEYCHLPSEAPWQKPDDPDAMWPEKGEILFDNYSTRYREKLDLVLKDVNFDVNSNEKVGIVGRTGAGKSSVTLALFRIIEPVEGTILIDNLDLSKLGLHALRSKLTIIPQDPVLFTGSLRFNLDPNDDYDDEAIWSSLENSHLKEFVSGLAEGLQHDIEEGGRNLSAGQKQLLCLARALLKKSKILILDEATAAVDMDTDSLVQDTIQKAFANHTVLTIAHRLNTVMDYDKIIVMDAGTVIEIGSPTDLLQNKDSHFFKLSRKAELK